MVIRRLDRTCRCREEHRSPYTTLPWCEGWRRTSDPSAAPDVRPRSWRARHSTRRPATFRATSVMNVLAARVSASSKAVVPLAIRQRRAASMSQPTRAFARLSTGGAREACRRSGATSSRPRRQPRPSVACAHRQRPPRSLARAATHPGSAALREMGFRPFPRVSVPEGCIGTYGSAAEPWSSGRR